MSSLAFNLSFVPQVIKIYHRFNFLLLHHAGALFYLLSACVNSNSNLNSFAFSLS